MRGAGAAVRWFDQLWSLRLSRFAIIGVASTAIYAVAASCLAGGFGKPLLPAAYASLAAYSIASMFSYAGHKYVTFLSHGTYVLEAPRFLVLTALGLAFAWLLPAILVDGLGMPSHVPIVSTCIIVPVVNYVILDRWVFATSRGRRPDMNFVGETLPAPAAARPFAAERGGLLTLAVITALAMVLQTRWGTGPDTSWLITVIERMGAGDVLYKDIIELNPPFSIWLYLAPVRFAGLIGASPETVVWLYVLAICLAGTLLTGWMLLQAGMLELRAAASVAVLLFAITVLLSGNSFTERDQIGAVLALPLFVLAAWRARPAVGSGPTARHWFVAGVGAGILAMVKPYYAVVVVAVACLLAVKRRDIRTFLLPEFVLSGVIALAYLALSYALYPVFFMRLVPFLRDTYMAFSWPLDMLMLMAMSWLALPIAYAFHRRLLDLPELSDFFMVGALAALIPYFLQGKGWPYHVYPAILFGSAALVVALATLFEKRPYEARIGHIVIVSAAILLAHIRFVSSEKPAAALVAAGLREGGHPTVGMLAGGIEKGHPLTRMINGRWTDLYCSDWIPVYAIRREMDLAAAGQNGAVERFRIMKAQYYATKYARLAEHPPQLLIVDRADRTVTEMVTKFGFNALLARYQRIASDGDLELYRLRDGAKAFSAKNASPVSASN